LTKKNPGAGSGTDTPGLTHAGTYLPGQLRQETAKRKRKRLVPESISTLIQRGLQIEAEEALDAGALAFMCRVMVMASLPHSHIAGSEFERRNGAFTLSILARAQVGLPYGTIPRLLLCWLTTEAVKTQSRELILGDSLSAFMRQLGLDPTGGANGSIGRLKNQSRRLFGSTITATYEGIDRTAEMGYRIADGSMLWWNAKNPAQGSLWESSVTLTEKFFNEVRSRPIPIDLRALRALQRSPLTLDVYVWLTYRMSYLKNPCEVSWGALQGQFGANYAQTPMGLRHFKAEFIKALAKVSEVYRDAKATPTATGLQLAPGRPHIRKLTGIQ
jgi:hypothetical protein